MGYGSPRLLGLASNEGGVETGGKADWANRGDPNVRGEVRVGPGEGQGEEEEVGNVDRLGMGGEAKWTLGNEDRGAVEEAVIPGRRDMVSISTEDLWTRADLTPGPMSRGSISVSSWFSWVAVSFKLI